jgi:ABC-type transporter Mla subunit MlaD
VTENILSGVYGFLNASALWLQGASDIVDDPTIPIVLSIAILALGAFAILYFLLGKMLPAFATLRRLRRRIKQTDGEEQFAAQYEDISRELSESKLVRHGWREFTETLILPKSDEPQVIKNTSRPSAYMNVSSAEATGLHLRLFQALPNYFVGLGLLFTFMGLVAALFAASEAVTAANVEQAQEALGKLLHAATFKFLTSIAGLFVSLVLGFTYRWSIQHYHQVFALLSAALEERLQFATPESIAFEQLREQQQQTLQLERFNTDFALEVANALEQKLITTLPSSLSTAMQPLSKAVSDLSGSLGEMNQEALEKMTSEFGENIRGAAGAEMQALAGTLEEIRNTLTSLSAGIGTASEGFGQQMADAATRIDETLSEAVAAMRGQSEEAAEAMNVQMSASLEGLQETVSSAGSEMADKFHAASSGIEEVLAPFTRELSSFTETVSGLEGQFSSQRQAFETLLGHMQEAASVLEGSVEGMRQAGEPIAQTAEQFAQAAERIRSVSDEFQETQREFSALGEIMNTTSTTLRSSWEDYQTRFENVDTSLASVFEKLSEGLDSQIKYVADFVRGLDAQLDKAMRSLSGGVEELTEAVEQVSDSADRIVESFGTKDTE